ncbi:Gfo/Idh/MocA family protein [Caloramator sp. Dgby_cultured_2]|uniref:Gfo/Idh/MocA family protein n=1 Tax=Caloramator sp. Dgby_cultured_2 TaxID=3029174 RepID=UPI00237E5EAB|nr:Gfo/Idh/MocA family oxidoreductase [Caloramator sp. Dgby_cultured_2]WDU82368.1 Gfo/Idh/MocA family oxidoreductase [Caloramator sp. Dgby_cultured_2]
MSIKVAIIGCGSIAEFRHAPEYYENPNVVIAGFYDKHYERAEKLAKKFGGKVYLNLEEIMKDETINAISDCTSNETHVLVSTEALNHGKHVLCEKPIATTLEDAEKILNAVEKSNKIFMVDYNQRLADAHKKAKEILKTGELGKVLTFSTTFGHKGPEYWSATKGNSTWFFKKNRSVLGVAADLGIHKIDLLRYILDDEFDEVFAFEAVLDKKMNLTIR